ncbi:MAG TPA: lysophospholipid acyltransferase family protein [Oryzihumus sp.]|nr:lysophospholipid acyltransferase family protein [Oryzihumus sp.]
MPAASVLAAAGRKLAWRAGFATLGHGVAVTGRLPAGGCVLVANHASHADTAALLAALPARAAPVAAAAADHWFATPGRALVCRALTGGRAVRRHGGGMADLLALAPLLAQGRTVIVFPEGSRTRDGTLGQFRSGAFTLATRAGVPVVPVALVGTAELLDLDGELRPAPVEVRLGAPMRPGRDDAASSAREQVAAALATGPARSGQARTHRVLAGLASSGAGLALAFAWGVAEATSWPLMAELLLMLLVPAAPRRWWRLALALAAGSVLGVLGSALAAGHGLVLPAPLTTPRMHATAAAQLRGGGAGAWWAQLRNGVPVKVYAAAAGRAHVPLPALALAVAAARTARIAAVAAVLAALGWAGRRPLRVAYGLYVPALLVGFAVLLSRVVAAWS